MKIDIRKHEYSIIWDGIYYHALSNYPNISQWELNGIIKFVEYEKCHDRKVEIVSDNHGIMEKVNYALANRDKFINIPRPEKITECTTCKQKGCITKYLCHTASLENALSIIKVGSILSAVKARNIPVEQLKLEPRNAAKDPADYFEYLMLSWGNCQAGDRLVMERKLEREPNEEDLSNGFTPGVRFFFKYDELIKHPNAVFDGYHPLKIKDELTLKDNVFAIIVPESYRKKIEIIINNNIKDKVYYIYNKHKDIWEWSETVYKFVDEL
jgi:hypothetical protein